MKSHPPFLCYLMIFLVVLSVMLSAGCIFPQTAGSSRSPSYDTAATTVVATQPQGANPASSQNTGSANCRSGLTDCSGFCRDLSVDIGNCGACGVACPSGQTCSNGQCTLSCKGGKTACSGACVDLTADLKNCGACGVACPSGQVCNNGQCGVKCINNLIYCNGQCRDLSGDSANCGACGVVCPAGQTCQNGQCGAMCGSGLTYCNGYCRNLYSDSSNCGSCGVICAAGSSCQNGQCIAVPLVINVQGAWKCRITSDFTMNLFQQYTTVTGNYASNGGQISSGTVSGNTLTATWNWGNGADYGPVTFTILGGGTVLDGTAYSTRYQANAPSHWTCTKLS